MGCSCRLLLWLGAAGKYCGGQGANQPETLRFGAASETGQVSLVPSKAASNQSSRVCASRMQQGKRRALTNLRIGWALALPGSKDTNLNGGKERRRCTAGHGAAAKSLSEKNSGMKNLVYADTLQGPGLPVWDSGCFRFWCAPSG